MTKRKGEKLISFSIWFVLQYFIFSAVDFFLFFFFLFICDKEKCKLRTLLNKFGINQCKTIMKIAYFGNKFICYRNNWFELNFEVLIVAIVTIVKKWNKKEIIPFSIWFKSNPCYAFRAQIMGSKKKNLYVFSIFIRKSRMYFFRKVFAKFNFIPIRCN